MASSRARARATASTRCGGGASRAIENRSPPLATWCGSCTNSALLSSSASSTLTAPRPPLKVRAGETLDEIMSKRSIKREEMVALNPGINLDSLKGEEMGCLSYVYLTPV